MSDCIKQPSEGDGDVFTMQTKLRHIQANLLQPTQQGLDIPDTELHVFRASLALGSLRLHL